VLTWLLSTGCVWPVRLPSLISPALLTSPSIATRTSPATPAVTLAILPTKTSIPAASPTPYPKKTTVPTIVQSTHNRFATLPPNELAAGEKVWKLVSVDYPDYITALGRVYSPPTRRDPFPAYVFMRLNFQCTSGNSLIQLYMGQDLGLNFTHKQAGYSDISIEDHQGRRYLVTLLGACWLAAPIPRTRAGDGHFILNIRGQPPFPFEVNSSPVNESSPICFISDRDGTKEVFISNSDGGNPVRLTSDFSRAAEPAWSPDHQRIAYVNYRRGNADIAIVDRDGNKVKSIAVSQLDEGGPAWSPVDNRLAFHTFRDGNWEIYIVDVEQDIPVNLTHSSTNDQNPSWSPDGAHIAFQSMRDGNWKIFIIDPDGKGLSQVTHQAGDDILPSWSPDGSQIAFWSKRSGAWRLYIIDLATGKTEALTTYENPGPTPYRAAWSPDGSLILITLLREGFLQLYRMDRDGQNLTRITDSRANDFAPDW